MVATASVRPAHRNATRTPEKRHGVERLVPTDHVTRRGLAFPPREYQDEPVRPPVAISSAPYDRLPPSAVRTKVALVFIMVALTPSLSSTSFSR